MSRSLLDQMAAAQATDLAVVAADPGTENFGIAKVWATVGVGSKNPLPITIRAAMMFSHTTSNKGPKKNWVSVPRHIENHVAGLKDCGSDMSVLAVEVQELYANTGQSPAELVSKANSLFPLSAIAGGLMEWAIEKGTHVHPVKPRDWMGQRSKAGNRAAVEKDLFALSRHGCTWVRGPKTVEACTPAIFKDLPALAEHAIDALGIALHTVKILSSGILPWPPHRP